MPTEFERGVLAVRQGILNLRVDQLDGESSEDHYERHISAIIGVTDDLLADPDKALLKPRYPNDP